MIEYKNLNLLYNNTTVNINPNTDSKNKFQIKCPVLGSGDVQHNTNSDFCKIQMIVNYNWQKIYGLNWLAIHRSESILAYVINPSYTSSLLKNTKPQPSEQVIRLINYENRTLGICKCKFASIVADLCFAYNCPTQKESLIAAVDSSSNVNVFSYIEVEDPTNHRNKYEMKLILEIKANSYQLYETLSLNWCPFVGYEDEEENEGDSDTGMKLAVASEKSIEVFSIDKLISCNSEFKRMEIDPEEHGYYCFYDKDNGSIMKIFLSSDGNAVCTASKDNNVKFFQFDSLELKQMHNWEPFFDTSAEKISFFCFLDDYNKLLVNYEHEFWGFAFVGTEKGEISIWNLREWKASQRLKIDFQDSDPNSVFEYKVDITSRFVVAINRETAFIIQISFDTSFNLEGSPKIIKITRFQLYNQILSFVCKRSSDKEFDVFWLTSKSLERCTIQTDQLNEETTSTNINPLLKIVQTDLNKTMPIIESNPKKIEKNIANSTMREQLNFFKTCENSFKTTFASSTLNQSSIQKSTNVEQSEKSTTPTSQEVENIFNILSASKNEMDLNKIMPPKLNNSSYSNFHSFSSKNANKGSAENLNENNSINQSNLDLSNYVQKENILHLNNKIDDLVKMVEELKNKNNPEEKNIKDCHLDLLEEKLLNEISTCKLSVTDSVKRVNEELFKIRKEWKDPNEYKFMNKFIETLLKKLMDKVNFTLSKGLEEFMDSVKKEINDLNSQVNKMKNQFELKFDQCCKKNEKISENMNSIVIKLKEISDQQQNCTVDLIQNLNNSSLIVSPSPKLLSSSFNSSVLSKEEQEKQIKRNKVSVILSTMKTQDSSQILKAVSLALDLKDEQVLTKVLYHFKENHEFFIQSIKKDQTVLISLLSQLTLQQLDKDLWKINFLPDIITSLDMKSLVVKNNLHLFIDKLIMKLKLIKSSDNPKKKDYESNLQLILFILEQCKSN